MVAITIQAKSFEFDAKPFSEAFNKGITELFREAARAFYRAAIVKIPIRTGFASGAFGVLGDLIGESSSGSATLRLKKAYLLKKKIKHLEATIEKIKDYERGEGHKHENIRDINRSGITEENEETASVATSGSKKQRKQRVREEEGGESEERQSKQKAFGRKNVKNFNRKDNPSFYDSEQVADYEKGRRAHFEAERKAVHEGRDELIKELRKQGKDKGYHLTTEEHQQLAYANQRHRLEQRVHTLKGKAAKLNAKLEKNPEETEKKHGLGLLGHQAHQQKLATAGPFEAKERKKIGLRRALKGDKVATSKELRLQYLRKTRDEILGAKKGSTKRSLQTSRQFARIERTKSGQGKIEFYYGGRGEQASVTLKTPKSGRNFAFAVLPVGQELQRAGVNIGSTIPVPKGNKIAENLHTSAELLNTISSLKNEYEFQFGINISYFNINDTNTNKRNASSPWQAMTDGRLAFTNYLNANYIRLLPLDIVSFLTEVEYTLEANGAVTKRAKRTSGVGSSASGIFVLGEGAIPD